MFGINHNQQYVPFIGQPTLGNGFTSYAPFTPYSAPVGAYAPYSFTGYPSYSGIPAYNGIPTNPGLNTPSNLNVATTYPSAEMNLILNRVEEIRHQVAFLCESMKLDHARHGMANGIGLGLGGQVINGQMNAANWAGLGFGLNGLENVSPIRLRESDSHIFMDVYLPQLTMGDVDVEVSGNRIVCRTRVPVAPISRLWANTQIPRGFELYELADGRVEFSWIAPVTFQAKEVEATWREGFLCVCIPKQEVTPRHTVKVVRETVSNRKSDAMNS